MHLLNQAIRYNNGKTSDNLNGSGGKGRIGGRFGEGLHLQPALEEVE